jgi:ATP-binding cassette subfamily C protein LapB
MRIDQFKAEIKARCTDWEIGLGLIASSVTINLLSLAFPLALLQIYDRIIPNSAVSTLVLLISGVILASVVEGILRILRTSISSFAEARYEYRLACRAFQHIQESQLCDYERQGGGVYLERFNALSASKDFYTGQALTALLDIPFVFIYLLLIVYLAGWVILFPILVLGAFSYFAIKLGESMRTMLTERRAHDERRINFVVEILQSIHTVKSLALEALLLRRYERLQESTARGDALMADNSGIAGIYSNAATYLTTILVVSFGAIQVMHGNLSIGGLAACSFLSGRVLQPITRIISVWSRMQAIEVSTERANRLIELPQETNANQIHPQDIKGEIRLKEVAFRYSEKGPWILENINLTIQKGEIIAITGDNQSGKSSVLYLINALFTPNSGEILIDDYRLNDLNKEELRQRVSYIPNHPVLFQGTVLENLTGFRSGLIADRARELCDELQLSEVIYQLPQGFETVLGQSAVDFLPQGFRQRIAIVRGLVTDPNVILFDEANSSIDAKSDGVLRAALDSRKGRCTQILVTHRPSYLQLANRCFILKGGKLDAYSIPS